MTRQKNCVKSHSIFGIETLWFANVSEPRESIRPMLELLNGAGFTYFSTNTYEELKFAFSKIKKSKAGIIYMASHGSPNKFRFGHGSNDSVALDDITTMLVPNSLRKVGVHVSACDFMKINQQLIDEFLNQTGAEFLSGYTKSVDWVESTCLDLLFLNNIQYCINDVSGMVEKFLNRYSQLVERTGFVIYLRRING